MSIILQEITEGGDYPNYIYMVNDAKDRALAYKKTIEDEWFYFSKPLQFSRRLRRFKTLKQ